ncbi:MAG: DEAD/DEAH box helicase [Candidatus Methanomethylophilaceae archaeon]|nr:DEAD/DEAH box helicase [Candidatus Methanomethylophilaceae archaeon]
MVGIEKVLKRFNSNWPELIGLPAWNAIRYREEYVDNSDKLIEYILLVTDSGNDILKDKNKRRLIFQKLSEDEAIDLLLRMGIEPGDYPIKQLVEISINEKRERTLCSFFNIPFREKEKVTITPDMEIIESEYSLHDYQKRIILKAMELYRKDNSTRFMIHMPTGSGKTRVAMSLLSRILMESEKTTILWLAYSEELCEQAVSEFKKSWAALGDREVNILRFYGNHDYHDIDDGLIVAGLSKLWAKASSEKTFISRKSKDISVVIFDEAHQSVAPTYLKMLEEISLFNSNCCFVGLSATPGRTNESESQMLSKFFDRNKITLQVDGYDSPIEYLYEYGFLSKPTFITYKYESNKEVIESGDLLLDYSETVLKLLGEDYRRNYSIIDRTKECIEKGHKKVVLFAPSVDSAEYISAMLNLEDIRSEVITSKTPSDVRQKTLNDFRKESKEAMVLCNYGILTTGFDVPKITAAIIARPTKSLVLYSQMIGRALRGSAMGGTDTADILVIVDINLPGYDSLIESFNQWSGAYGWKNQRNDKIQSFWRQKIC